MNNILYTSLVILGIILFIVSIYRQINGKNTYYNKIMNTKYVGYKKN